MIFRQMESGWKIALIVLVVCTVVSSAEKEKCPAKYSGFSAKHSFCLDPNPKCTILKEGVDKKDIKLILKWHNKLRSRVANGREKRGGGLPAAANMLQMEWDHELAAIAQKWASQCDFNHDCNDCRKVEKFSVGQNMGFESQTCQSDDCIKNAVNPKWEGVIRRFYREVKFFNKKYIDSFGTNENTDKAFGHFTQIIWAKTWKVGCGYVAYKENAIKRLYVCNYGPAGNYQAMPIYQPGEKCSACPSNTCCGGTCKQRGRAYRGLCKVKNLSEGPVYEKAKA